MLLKKIQYKIKRYSGNFSKWVPRVHISNEIVLMATITSLISILLINSIYSSINDLGKYKTLDIEEQRRDELLQENEDLLERKGYVESEYYRRLYAREVLNLAKTNQELFFVDRKEQYDYDKLELNDDPINIENNRTWWYKLIL